MTVTDRKPDEGEIRRLLEIMATLRGRARRSTRELCEFDKPNGRPLIIGITP